MNMDDLTEALVEKVLEQVRDYSFLDRHLVLLEVGRRLEKASDQCLREEYGLLNEENDERD